MFTLLLIIEIIVSFLLIVAVLMQASKGGGLAGVMSGGQVGTMFGVRRTADFLSKATTWLAVMFVGLCLVMNLFFLPTQSTNQESVIQEGAPASSQQR
ncbi:MAG: preprotein translocase subunit SecG [Ignavibacteriales bacterium]|nr:preprotein translocase subunit SecG [Ignavibacteriales bacterium]